MTLRTDENERLPHASLEESAATIAAQHAVVFATGLVAADGTDGHMTASGR